MDNVEFQEENTPHRHRKTEERKGWITKFLNRQGLDDGQARKVMYTVAIIAFGLSLFFWF